MAAIVRFTLLAALLVAFFVELMRFGGEGLSMVGLWVFLACGVAQCLCGVLLANGFVRPGLWTGRTANGQFCLGLGWLGVATVYLDGVSATLWVACLVLAPIFLAAGFRLEAKSQQVAA